MHAINNLLQDQFFGKEEMFDIGLILLEEIGDYEAIEDVETFNENGTPFKNYLFNSKGDFSQDILVRCLNLAVNAETIDCLVDTPNSIELVRLEWPIDEELENNLHSESAFIINQLGQHWIALRKIGGFWMLFDSLKENVIPIVDIYKYLKIVGCNNDNSVFIVKGANNLPNINI